MNAMPAEKNVGDPTSKYPDAVDIPQVKMDGMEKPPETNPVVSAFETIMKYVKALEDKKDPKAGPVKEHLTALVQSVVGGAAGAEAAPMAPEAGAEPAPEQGAEDAPPMKPVAGGAPAKIGFDPYKDPEMDAEMPDEEMDEEEMAKKKMKNRKPNMNTTIKPLA
jgi:hypothetical protein